MRFPALFVACGLALLLSTASASAGTTLKYPAAKPVVVLDVPEEWTAEEDKSDDNHKLTFSSKDENLACQIILMSLAQARPQGLQVARHQDGARSPPRTTKMADPEFNGPLENKSGNGVPLTTEVIKGKIGVIDITLMIGLFTLKGLTYAMIVSSESSILNDSAKTADEIIDSVHTLN